jgi:hypothetical protein
MIFLKNIDIWGFTMIYISIVEHLYNSFKNLTDYHLQIINKIKYIIIHFLYENPLHPINIDSLVVELTKLNDIINNEKKTDTNTNDITKTDTNTNDITKTDTNTKYFEKKGSKSYKLFKSYKNNKTRRRIMK